MLETVARTLVWQLPIATTDLVTEYVAYQQAAGYAAKPKVRHWGARAFLQRYPDLESWRDAPLKEQLGLQRSLKYFANFLFLRHYLRPTMDYLLTARPKLAQAGKRYLYRQAYGQLYDLGGQLRYADSVLRATLNFLFYVMAYAGKQRSSSPKMTYRPLSESCARTSRRKAIPFPGARTASICIGYECYCSTLAFSHKSRYATGRSLPAAGSSSGPRYPSPSVRLPGGISTSWVPYVPWTQ